MYVYLPVGSVLSHALSLSLSHSLSLSGFPGLPHSSEPLFLVKKFEVEQSPPRRKVLHGYRTDSAGGAKRANRAGVGQAVAHGQMGWEG